MKIKTPNDLGNSTGGPLTYRDPFINLQSGNYWSETVTYSSEERTNIPWYFTFNSGYATNDYGNLNYALAVRSVSVVPEPISSTLFISGSATLGFRRFWKKRRTV